jgi:NAD(P)-dependent dehydrogenase (short-subunit alcohol dehydrogenase family)
MTWLPDPDALRGRVAVVTGATRGAGRGIAAALGEAGATVICTGRSSRHHAIRFIEEIRERGLDADYRDYR